MGIFDVHMPLLYGGGYRGSLRLQEEIINVSAATDGLKQFALGFDFDFNPVCILQDSNTEGQLNIRYVDTFDWTSTAAEDIDWDKMIEGRVYLRENYNRLWFLRGDRIRGLDVLIPAEGLEEGDDILRAMYASRVGLM